MVQYLKKVDGRLRELESAEPLCWINIAPPFSHEELEDLSRSFEIPLDFLTDSLDIDERSRFEREESTSLILINTPVYNEVDRQNESIYITVPIGIIIAPDYIFTITSFENPVIDLFLEDKVKNFDPSNKKMFIMQIFEQTVYRYLVCLKKLNLKRNIIERELYDSSRNKELRQLLNIEKSLVYFVNSLSANELLKLKIKRTDFLKIKNDEDLFDLYEDIIIDNSQALEMANVYTNILNGTMEAYASIISNNLNIVIQRLTLITIILMVPTLFASLYGMNVNLPFHDSQYAFWGVLSISIFLSLAIAWFFKQKRLF